MAENSAGTTVVFGKLAGIGLLTIGVAALIAALSLFVRTSAPARQASSFQKLPAPQAHDFQVVQLGTFRRDQFLLDKDTGRVWHSTCVSQAQAPSVDCSGVIIWDEMYVSGVTPSDSPAALEFKAQLQNQK